MNYLLIDTSYLNFYRYYATLQWYKKSHPTENIDEIEDWTIMPDFMKTYEKMYKKCIHDMISKYNIDPSKIIFAFDCKRDSIWRMAIRSDYKSGRKEQQSNFKGGTVFRYSKNEIIPELCKKYNCNYICVDNAEADDIVGITKKYIRSKYPSDHIYIITSDHDYLQLIDENTKIYNLKNKCLNDKSCGDSQKDLLIKIIQGDASDSIPACFDRCGYKTALKLANNNSMLLAKLESNEAYKKQFELNTQLIDMNKIPEYIQQSVIDKIKHFIS